MRRLSPVLFTVLVSLLTIDLRAAEPLRIRSAGPEGEIATLSEANEIRVIFSEPMVVLGRIPDPVKAPFFRIKPAVNGTFRWSGTTTLIFTPDPSKALPFATQYEVTVDSSATSINGNKLASPHTFRFTTPTVKLLRTVWYRDKGSVDGPVLIALTFNQPVSDRSVGSQLEVHYQKHDFQTPEIPPEGRERLTKTDPASLAAFDAKVAKAAKAAASEAPVFGAFTDKWDTNVFGHKQPEMIVYQTQPGVSTDGWLRVTLGKDVKGLAGPSTPGTTQEYTIRLEQTFFVRGFYCRKSCEPDNYNSLGFRSSMTIDDLRKAITVWDITDPKNEIKLKPVVKPADGSYVRDNLESPQLEDLGYSPQPARTYLVRVDAGLKSVNGQTLGYTWMGSIENWHRFAYTSFGDRHGVWEASGGATLPFYSRNLETVTQSTTKLSPDELMPTIVKLEKEGFRQPPPGKPALRKLPVTPDKVQSHGLDITPWLGPKGTGLFWTSITEGKAIARARRDTPPTTRSTVVQVTNLAINVKDSPQGALIFVTGLNDGRPVEGSTVTIRGLDNKVKWTGTTDKNGIAMSPPGELRPPEVNTEEEGESEREESFEDPYEWYDTWALQFIVTAEKDGDIAYVGSNWNEGILPYEFSLQFDLSEGAPLLRGTLFTDRGVYKLGEEAHVKVILRSDTPTGLKLLPAGTEVKINLHDSQGRRVEQRTIKLNEWSSGEWVMRIPADGSLGGWSMRARVATEKGSVYGSFLVAAYRRPDFRVDTNIGGEDSIAGAKLRGVVNARYLFGGAMSGLPVKWTYSKSPNYSVPTAVSDKYPLERYTFLGWDETRERHSQQTIASNETKLDPKGMFSIDLDTTLAAEVPYDYSFEGSVTDVSRQQISGRASFRVHPAPWYLGLKTPSYFVDTKQGLDTEIVAVTPAGSAASGVPIQVTLKQIQWHSVRRAEGEGFYGWETERRETEKGKWTITSAEKPVPLHADLSEGGYYALELTAEDGQGRSTRTVTNFYVIGAGYTAWERYDHNRIDLVPERKTWKPGETARIMVKSPWEKATALLTTEREGIRSWKQFTIDSTQQTLEVPITEKDVPNVFVSVLIVKGRSEAPIDEEGSDPGKPAFRLGYVELSVEDSSKKLAVTLKANRDEYRPASKAKIELEVRDSAKKPVQSEVTLWAVDFGVLSLTGYKTPEVLDSVWVRKALQVMNEDSRQRIISRRVLTPKGADEGGGGGADAGPGALRKDFRVLAFWLGSVTTDKNGKAKVDVTLPESLTTYRIMAVAADAASRFGWAEKEIRTNKPVLLRAAYPRFLAVGDDALFGSVVQNQLTRGGAAIVTMKSLDPSVLEIVGDPKQTVQVGASGSSEVRFRANAKAIGDARIQMTVRLLGEEDAFEDVIPVRILVSPESVAAYGEVKEGEAKEKLEIPGGVVPSFGGLQLELASTAMVGLGEGARYVVEYPYGCAEQRASRGLVLMLASDLGDAFRLPGIQPAQLRNRAQENLRELEKFQCPSGGFAYWPGQCDYPSPYLTSWVVHVFQRGVKLGYAVSDGVLDRAYDYLEGEMAQTPPVNEGWWPGYTAWQSFVVKVLVEGGRNQDSNVTRLYGYRERMPVFALAYLHDAMTAKGEKGSRLAELERKISNAILPEGGTAHVGELSDPYLLFFWNSNVRSTAIVLRSLVQNTSDTVNVRGMVRWLMQARVQGRWGNTQENAWAMEALVDYYKKYESEVPDFTALVTLGQEQIASETFKGRSTEAKRSELKMPQILAKGPAGQNLDLVLKKQGTGTLFYMARLRYASNELFQNGLDHGFRIERSYEPLAGGEARKSFAAGDLVRVVLKFKLTKERRWVAVTDPLPAGFEAVESWFNTTARDLATMQVQEESQGGDWMRWFQRGGFDYVERHDDRVQLFATRLSEGSHEFSYVARATTAGTFRTAPAHVEEMYEPEAFGRTATDVVEVK